MDSLKRRKTPKTPNSEKFNAEILPSPYVGGKVEGSFRSEPTPDVFALERQHLRDLRDMLRELQPTKETTT